MLGFEVSNITYPHPDIVGHRILRGERTIENKTILDKGVLTGTKDKTSSHENEGMTRGVDTNLAVTLYNPKTMVDEQLPGGNHFFVEGMYNPATFFNVNTFESPGFFNGNTSIAVRFSQNYGEDLQDLPDRCNYAIDGSILLSRDSRQIQFGSFEKNLRNISGVDKAAFYHIQEDAQDVAYPERLLVALKTSNDVFNNLSAINYLGVTDSPQYNVQTQTIFTGSDTVITAMGTSDLRNITEGGFFDSAEFFGSVGLGFWIESEYNWDMRHEGTEVCNSYFKEGENPPSYWIERIADPNDSNQYIIKNLGDVCDNFHAINKDFLKENKEKVSFPLSASFDYCSKCLNHYPDRLYYSRRDDLESDNDNYRNILPNSYRNLDTIGDSIQRLVVDKDQMYAITTSYIYFIPTNSQQVQTDENVAYIGTGDRLAIPPQKLVSTPYKYGGTTQKHAIQSTQFGVFYADDKSGKIFKIGKSLEEISAKGMSQFFEEHLPLVLNSEYERATGEQYWSHDSVASLNGTGIKLVFDPRYKRLIVHKKDYKPLFPFLDANSETQLNRAIYVDSVAKKFYISTPLGQRREINVNDSMYFKNISWTKSFSIELGAWASFHSYIPDWSLNNHNHFCTTKDSKIYKHGTDNYLTFYGQKYPHFIETVINDKSILNKTLGAISITGDTYEEGSYVCDTFNKVWAYTPRQSTGYVNLEMKPTLGFGEVNYNDTLFVRENKDKYNFNGLRNRLVSLPSYTEDFIHRTPVNTQDVSFYDQARIKGDYINLRLIFDKESNYRINTHSLIIGYTNSNR